MSLGERVEEGGGASNEHEEKSGSAINFAEEMLRKWRWRK